MAGGPVETLAASLVALQAKGVEIIRCSPWYRSRPVPVSDQDWYVNGVATVETNMDARGLLDTLHDVEVQFGRRRSVVNEPRVLDLDLLAYGDLQMLENSGLNLPHPRLHERAFVLVPLSDIAPDWRHPVSKLSISGMMAAMPDGQVVEQIA
jgi:2-amino-4-hydroxy-6-hydroxymethyldihydropteridine diphosphokinase